MFFSFVIDVYSRRVIGWQLAGHMRPDLVLDAPRMALARRRRQSLSISATPGSTSYHFNHVLDDHRVLSSIGSVGDAFGTALAESFVDSSGETELIAERVWKTRTQLAIAEYIVAGYRQQTGTGRLAGVLYAVYAQLQKNLPRDSGHRVDEIIGGSMWYAPNGGDSAPSPGGVRTQSGLGLDSGRSASASPLTAGTRKARLSGPFGRSG